MDLTFLHCPIYFYLSISHLSVRAGGNTCANNNPNFPFGAEELTLTVLIEIDREREREKRAA